MVIQFLLFGGLLHKECYIKKKKKLQMAFKNERKKKKIQGNSYLEKFISILEGLLSRG